MADEEPSRARRVRPRRQGLRRVENEDARHVTFSKRRKGLFKKASELATLCGAEVGILVNSPAGRPYTFGSPAIEPIINRFLSNDPNQAIQNPNQNLFQLALTHMNQQYSDLESRHAAANFRRVLLNDRLNRAANAAPECKWSENIDGLQMDELRRLFDTMCQTKARLLARQNELIQAGGASSSNANAAIIRGPPHGLIIGNNHFAGSSRRTNPQMVQTIETMVNPPESETTNFIPPSVNLNSGAGSDLSLVPSTRPIAGFSPSSGGANSAFQPPAVTRTGEGVPSMMYAFNFGSGRGNQNTEAGSSRNTEIFMNPGAYGQTFGTRNLPVSFNFSPNIVQPNPLRGISDRSNPIESNSLASLCGPFSSSSQGQFLGTGSGGQNLLGGFDSDAQVHVGPSTGNTGTNHLFFGPGQNIVGGLDSGVQVHAESSTDNTGMNHLFFFPGQNLVGGLDSGVQVHAGTGTDNTSMNHFVLGPGQNLVGGISSGAQDQAGPSTSNTGMAGMNHIIIGSSISDIEPKEVDSKPTSSNKSPE